MAMDAQATTKRKSCSGRARPAPRNPGDIRPTDVVGAFFLAGAFFLIAALICAVWQAVDPWPWGRWLALHLAFVGGVSQLILGASQFFAGAFLATEPPPKSLIRGQLITWNLGAVLLAFAVPNSNSFLLWTAIALLVAALGLWMIAIFRMRQGSLSKAPWATRWYLTCVVFFAAGMIVGSLMADGVYWSHGFLLGAHMSLNLAGFFGTAIVGTLHTFYPSLTQTQLRFPELQRFSFRFWASGVLALAVGYAWSLDGLAVAGWLALTTGALALLVNLVDCRRRAENELSLAARIVGAGQPFLLAGLLVISTAAISNGPALALSGSTRIAAGTLLVVGWIGLTVFGSLLHLLAVVVRVRSFTEPMPRARPRADFTAAVAAAASVACLAACQLAGQQALADLVRVAVLVVYAYLAATIATRVSKVIRKARPRI